MESLLEAGKCVSRITVLIVVFSAIFSCSSSDPDSNGNTQPSVLGDSEQLLNDPITDGPSEPADPLSTFEDCETRLPCQWTSLDDAIIVNVVSVTLDSRTGQLNLSLSFEATRDTEVEWMQSVTGLSSSGAALTGSSDAYYIGGVLVEEDRQNNLLAGLDLLIEQNFSEKVDSSTESIARYSYGFIEAGKLHELNFLNLPVSRGNTEEVNCRFTLPCEWLSGSNNFKVSVLTAGGLSVNGTLSVTFSVEAYKDLILVAGEGWEALSSDGDIFKPKTHSLGTESDFRSIEQEMIRGSVLTGGQTYFKNTAVGISSMSRVPIELSVKDAPSGLFPVFLNLPVF